MPPPPPQPSQPIAEQPRPKVYLTTPQAELAVSVEVVATEPMIEKGLMFRENLPPDDGMLFLMPREQEWPFWMRNTLISLDLIFIDKSYVIAGIVENATPRTDALRTVHLPSLYVLEVNAGWCAAHHVAAGQKVRFERVPGH
jgi:uncharacterized membrane protein (UPF0127 family)